VSELFGLPGILTRGSCLRSDRRHRLLGVHLCGTARRIGAALRWYRVAGRCRAAILAVGRGPTGAVRGLPVAAARSRPGRAYRVCHYKTSVPTHRAVKRSGPSVTRCGGGPPRPGSSFWRPGFTGPVWLSCNRGQRRAPPISSSVDRPGGSHCRAFTVSGLELKTGASHHGDRRVHTAR